MQIDEKGNTITRDEFVRVDVVFLSFLQFSLCMIIFLF